MTPTLTAQPIGHTTPAEWLWVVGVVSLLVAVSGWLVATGAPSRRPWPFSWLERASSSLQRVTGLPSGVQPSATAVNHTPPTANPTGSAGTMTPSSRTAIPTPRAAATMTPSALEPEVMPDSVLMRARRLGLTTSRMPSLGEGGEALRLAPVAVEDLLLRPSVKIDYKRLENFVAGKSIVVTGAPALRSARRARSELPHITNCGVPFMNRVTGSLSITVWIFSRSSLIRFLSL